MLYSEVDWLESEYPHMLISQDLMQHLSKFVEPPAQLCLIRVLGSDHEYVFRVRYGDVHLDYPCAVPLLDNARQVEPFVNTDALLRFLTVASAMVVPPDAHANCHDRFAYSRPQPPPQILAPMQSDQFHFWTP